MSKRNTVILLTIGFVLQILRAGFQELIAPYNPPEWTTLASVLILLALWAALGVLGPRWLDRIWPPREKGGGAD